MYKWLLFIISLSLAGYCDARMMGMGGGMMGSDAEPPAPPAKNAAPDVRKGYDLVQSYCVQCHQPPHPTQHTAAEWPNVLARMEQYMKQQHRHVPTDSDRKQILDYLDKQP